MGPKAIIIDDLNDPSKNIFCPNRNWTTKGTFTYSVGQNAEGAPLGVIDFHQVSTGFGAHAYFAGNRVATDTAHAVSGRWNPTNLSLGTYLIKAHIPRAGASAGSAVYRALAADGAWHEKVVNQHEHYIARLHNEVQKAKEFPDVDDDGISVASWLGLSDPHLQRPTSTQKPPWFETADRSYKIRSEARVSFVADADGTIIEGSADIEYKHRTGTTYLPRFIPDMFAAIQQDYGVPAPDLSYTAENLNLADHQIVAANPSLDGGMPGRAHKPAAAGALVTGPTGWPDPTGGTCVNALYVSGGTIGYRAMLGTGYITPRVAAWMNQVRNKPYTQAPPIWQELQFQVCVDGTVRPSPMNGNSGILRTSWMPTSYLWLDGKSINLGGSLQATVTPVLVGDFQSFSKLPGPGPGAYGSCKSDSGRNGNPWNIAALTSPVDVNPGESHFCVDENRESDPEPGE